MTKARIMVVEDEVITAMYIQEVLEGLGYEVVAVAASGEEAIEQAAVTCPDLILMDIMLQGEMDGVEAARRIREIAEIPLIYLTAAADAGILERAKVTEPFAYIIKPFEERDLLSNIEMALYKSEMERRLKKSYQQEQQARRRSRELSGQLSSILHSLGEGVLGLDSQGRITFVNSALERLTGWKEAELLGKRSHDILHHTKRDGSRHLVEECPIFSSALNGDKVVHSDEDVFWRKDGTSFDAEYTTASIQDKDGRTTGAVVVLRDISERKRIEAELRRHSETLERMVAERTAELQSFSYSVSHDLRAPLRAINGFSQALLEDYGECLDEGGRDFLERILKGSQRMGRLIDGLLALSRVINAELSCEQVDLSLLASEIAQELAQAEPQRTVEFEVVPDLTAWGDPALLRVLLENLLKNAWKYTRKREHARIAFGQTRMDGRMVFFVKDNGAGFDMKFASQLFEPFRRLHDQSEFEGTGIGLATVYRVVKRHGGRVWAEGAPDLGAAVYFTLDVRCE